MIFPETVLYFQKRSHTSRNSLIFPETVSYFQKRSHICRNSCIFPETVGYIGIHRDIYRDIYIGIYRAFNPSRGFILSFQRLILSFQKHYILPETFYISRNGLIFPETILYLQKRSYISRNCLIFPETISHFQKQLCLSRNSCIFPETVGVYRHPSAIPETVLSFQKDQDIFAGRGTLSVHRHTHSNETVMEENTYLKKQKKTWAAIYIS